METQVGLGDSFLDDTVDIPLATATCMAMAVPPALPPPQPPRHPPPTAVAAGWADITESAAQKILNRQGARKKGDRPFEDVGPSRAQAPGETAKDYLLSGYALCLTDAPQRDDTITDATVSINYGAKANGKMARRCQACGWMADANLQRHIASDVHRSNVRVEKEKVKRQQAEEAVEVERVN
jgi:hypothetical protein